MALTRSWEPAPHFNLIDFHVNNIDVLLTSGAVRQGLSWFPIGCNRLTSKHLIDMILHFSRLCRGGGGKSRPPLLGNAGKMRCKKKKSRKREGNTLWFPHLLKWCSKDGNNTTE